MAGKKKKKDKKTKSGSLSHIGGSLFPSAVFAAASPSLASTWPRRSQSPISKAVGEAGVVGRAFMGDMNRTFTVGSSESSPARRPPADLPSTSGQQVDESQYECVETGPGYDKKTAEMKDRNGESSGSVGDDKDKDKPEPVYAQVDKSKKKSAKQPRDSTSDSNLYDDEADDGSIAISSDDDLTDVTSNDDESSSYGPVKRLSKRSQKNKKTKPIKVQRKSTEESVSEEQSHHEYDDVTVESPRSETVEGESKKKSSKRSLHLSKKRNSIDAVDGSNNEHQGSEGNEGHYSSSGVKRGSKKSSLKKKSQVAPGEDVDPPTTPKTANQLERLGFEGTSQKVELSDISEDEEAFSLRAYHPSKPSDKKTRRRIINEEIQMTQTGENNAVEGSPSSLFDEKPPDGHVHVLANQKESVGNDKSVSMFNEQKKQLEELIRQQEDVFRQQAQQQKEQQAQAVQLAQQQLELQKQLQHLELIQHERLNSSLDHTLPKDVAQQQENFFRLQQQQQAKYDDQQERVLSQQQKICDQIKELEYQQRQLQSNISMLSPKEKDLVEIRWQEKEILRLLNEQQSHQEDYDKLHKLQQKQLEDQAALFQQERKVLESQQEALLTKIKEQEEKSKQLEIELHSLSAKPTKKVRHSKKQQESEDDISMSQLDEVDAVPVSHTNPSPRSHKKTKKPSKSPISSSIDLLQLENSRLSDLNVSLQNENEVLRQFTESVEKGTGGGESLVTQQYIKDLQQENKILQDTVHRLNVELSRYQMKYRPATVEEVDSLIFPKSTGSCPWLVNTKFLAPLFVSYDDKLKEKDGIIKVYNEEMTAFKARLMEIVKENQDLHMRIAESKPDALVLDEWQKLQEQAKLVVEENSILMKQQDLQQRKIKEMHQMHGQDISKLSIRITSLESEKKTLKTHLEDSQCNYNTLLQKYEALFEQEDKKIPIEEHLAIMEECRSIMEDMKANKKSENEEMESKVEAIKQEKKSLAMELTDCKAQNSQLAKELEIHRKTQRKLERKNVLLERKLEHIFEREITAQQTLDEVLKIAEKTAEERDSFEEFAKTQELKQKRSKSMIQQGDMSIIGLKEKLKSNKRKSSEKLALITVQLNEKEKEVNKIKAKHEKEINRLRELVREKQKAMEEMMGEKRMFDQQLDEVWKKADQETQQMKKSILEDRITGSPEH